MKNILILSYFFPPMGGGGTQRMTNFANVLPSLNWQPHIVTVKRISHYFHDPVLLKDLGEKANIYRTGSLDLFRFHHLLTCKSNKNKSINPISSNFQGLTHFFFIPDNRIGWYPFALRKARSLVKKNSFDVILSSSPPNTSHLVAQQLHKETNIPWIADFRDDWVGNPNLPMYTPFHFLIQKYLESRVIKAANLVLVVSPGYKTSFLKRHPDINPDKIIFLPNGYNEEKFPEKIVIPKKFNIIHTGIFTGNRRPDTFLHACKYLKDKTGVRSEIIWDMEVNFLGPMNPLIQNLIKKYGLQDIVHCRGCLSHMSSIEYLLNSAINLLIVNIKGGHNEIIPSKLFEYLATRHPILALCEEDGEVAKIIRETSSGTVVKPDDYRRIAEVLEEYYILFKKHILPKTELLKIKKYARSNIIKEFVGILDTICD